MWFGTRYVSLLRWGLGSRRFRPPKARQHVAPEKLALMPDEIRSLLDFGSSSLVSGVHRTRIGQGQTRLDEAFLSLEAGLELLEQ